MTIEQLTDFYYSIYSQITGDGKNKELLGNLNKPVIKEVLKQSHLVCPEIWKILLEFPLKGNPWYDISLGGWNHNPQKDACKDNKDSWQKMPYGAAYRFLTENIPQQIQIGTTWDLSSTPGQVPQPCFYSGGLNNPEAIRGALTHLGKKQMLPVTEKIIAQIPPNWKKCYFGFFPPRNNSPIRLGVYIPEEEIIKYHQNHNLLRQDLERIGYTDTNEAMLKEICHPVYAGFGIELQIDILSDGQVGPVLGLGYGGLFLTEKETRDKKNNYEQSKAIFEHLKALDLCDNRWELIPNCFKTYKMLSFANHDVAKITIDIIPCMMKIKWQNKKPLSAKYYLKIHLY